MLADSVGVALLVVLGTLTPAERLVFVLHDLFATFRNDKVTHLDVIGDSARLREFDIAVL